MERSRIPLIILAGSDHRAAILPAGSHGRSPLLGTKGVDLRVGDRPLIAVLVEIFADLEAFDPIVIAGPASLYDGVVGEQRIIDTDGSFGDNIEKSFELISADYPGSPIALASCDIVPKKEELLLALKDYERHQPLAFWFPLVAVPERKELLGESAWKPRYHVVPVGESKPVPVLPSHLVIVDPESFRRSAAYHSFAMAYASRNQPVIRRLWLLIRHLVAHLLWRDLRDLVLHFQPPTTAWTMLRNGIRLGYGLKDGKIAQERVEELIERIFLRRPYRKAHPNRRGRLPVLAGILGLAKDIDTREEALERGLRPVGNDAFNGKNALR